MEGNQGHDLLVLVGWKKSGETFGGGGGVLVMVPLLPGLDRSETTRGPGPTTTHSRDGTLDFGGSVPARLPSSNPGQRVTFEVKSRFPFSNQPAVLSTQQPKFTSCLLSPVLHTARETDGRPPGPANAESALVGRAKDREKTESRTRFPALNNV